MAENQAPRPNRKTWMVLVVLVSCFSMLAVSSAVSSSTRPDVPSTLVSAATATFSPTQTYAPPSTTPPIGQPPRPVTPPPGYVEPASGGRVYCGLQQGSVWLDVPSGFTTVDGVQFYCEPTTVGGAWYDQGYRIDFDPQNTAIIHPLTMVFEIGPAEQGTVFAARYAEVGSNQWQDLPTAYDPNTQRVEITLGESLPIFEHPGLFIVALFVQQAPPTNTATPTSTATPRPPTFTTTAPPPVTSRPPTNTPIPTAPPTATAAIPTPSPTLPQPTGGEPSSGLLIMIGLLVVILVIAIILVIWLTSRKPKPQRPAPGARPQRQPAQGGELVLLRGQAQPPRMSLSQAVVRIGRSTQGNDIVVADPPVSGRHAEIRLEGGNLILQDLASTNGTFLNGRRLTAPQSLHNGDRIIMGNTEWMYRTSRDTASMRRR